MSSEDKFMGWLALAPDAVEGKLVWQAFEPKPWEETDIDIRITHCGICGSDIHMMRSGWGPAPYPVCVGHEIVGTVVRVGSQAEGGFRIGDRVGVGPQSDSCLGRFDECKLCSSGLENYCPQLVSTYAAKHFNGGPAMGGYGLYHRCPSHFVVKIPDSLASAYAAPILCAGATVYAPLKKYGCGPGKTVGVVSIGGLGHFALLFAKAMGADTVVAISRDSSKAADALALGATKAIATTEDANWVAENHQSLDIIISTASSSKAPLGDYLSLLKVHGTLVQVGSPDDGDFSVPGYPLIFGGVRIVGSCIGSPQEMRETLEFAAMAGIKPWVEERPMSQTNQAVADMVSGKPRYRYVLVDER